MIKAVKKDTGNLLYMRLLKHKCPCCSSPLKLVKMKKVLKSKTKEATNFNFTACSESLGEKVKFIWYEFKCRKCNMRYTEDTLRKLEKQAKAEAAAKKKIEKKKAATKARAKKIAIRITAGDGKKQYLERKAAQKSNEQ